MAADGRPVQHRRVRISATSAVLAVVAVALALVAQRVFTAAHRPLSWAAAAVVVAVLIDPIVDAMDRRAPHVPRLLNVILALLVAGGATFGITYMAFDDLAAGIDRFGVAAEDAARRLEARDDGVGQLATDVDASRRVEQFVDALEERTTGGEEVLVQGAGSAPTYFVGGILTLFLMSYGPRLAASAVEQLPRAEQRWAVTDTVSRALPRARRAVLLTLVEGLAVGLIVGGVARLLDLPAPAALGLGAGLMALLPHVGIVLGTLPTILLLLALRSDVAALIAAGCVLAVQLADSTVVRRAVARRSVHVGLLVPWVVVLVGYRVYGVGGAAYGLAFAVFGLAILDEIGLRRPAPDLAAADAGTGATELRG
ncbi:MAG TPA: AI-2E family transporter [Acidimicrobiales bacterium]